MLGHQCSLSNLVTQLRHYPCKLLDLRTWVLCCRDHILAEDLEHFLNAKHAAEAFDMLDDDKDGKASLKDVRAAVCTIFRCRLLFAYAPLLFQS